MEGIHRFDDRVANYERFRPGYPDAVAGVLEGYCLRAPCDVADIGAGTGKLAEVFVRAGHRVTLVEPNDAMRAVAERNFAPVRGEAGVPPVRGEAEEPPVRAGAEAPAGGLPSLPRGAARGGSAVVRAGKAEATGLPDASVDAIVAGQAFHWFEPRATRAEWLRILRPGGVVALVWNDRRTRGSALLAEYERLLLEHCPEYTTLSRTAPGEDAVLAFLGGGTGAARGASVAHGPSIVSGTPASEAAASAPGPVGTRPRISTFPNLQDLDWEGFLGRALSASYVPLSGPAHDALVAGLRAAFERHSSGGRVVLPYDTRVFHARLV